MTDNKIIKALECHMSKSLDDCEKCPYYAQKRAFRNCHEHLYQDLLFLVNRQRADIDWLFGIVRTYKLRWAKATTKLDTAKAEAVKEFAERLCKDRVSNDPVVIAVETELKFWEKDNG